MKRDRSPHAGLDLLATAVVVLDGEQRVLHLNPAAEQLLDASLNHALGEPFAAMFAEGVEFADLLAHSLADGRGLVDPVLVLTRLGHEPHAYNCIVTPVESGEARLVIELRQIEQQLRIEREAQRITQAEANRELIRNLAHEIKNPLGGLRGSAQLLERELDRADLREYTQVIIKEADRLQRLMDRLLSPGRMPHVTTVNIHEVCERVRSLILAEFPEGIRIRRNYDASLPEFQGDREQLIQALLNIVRNAAQALGGRGEIELVTRVARQVTLAKTHHRLALELRVIDNGPGIPPSIRDKVFFPLVSGRDGGTGLGLTLAQNFVQHHRGVIEVDSQPGRTCFRIVLPLK